MSSSSLVLLTVLAPAYALVLASPGPNLLVMLRASLSRSSAATPAAALGIGCGAGAAALGAMLATTWLTQGLMAGLPTIEIVGRLVFAFLLARAGWRSLLGAGRRAAAAPAPSEARAAAHFRLGLLAALCNPLTLPFFATFFLGHPETRDPRVAVAACGLILLMAVSWFASVGLLLTRPAWRERMARSGRWPEFAIGCALLASAGLAAWPLHAYAGL